MRTRHLCTIGLLGWALACGGTKAPSGGGSPGGGGGATITIQNYAFSPANLTVAPGTTVQVVNLDGTPHSVTSETTPDAFVLGSVHGVQFDTGLFTGTASFTISSSAPAGTVIPYFCTIHKAMMANQGQITISGANPDAGSGTGGGGY